MLQQTRVETVIPYYDRFLREFPDVFSLAKASEERVLKKWEGLGYYSRARNLHAAACELASGYGGEFPHTSDRLRRLPGFGPYTSAAVASIAFGEPVAVFDGNVRRVVSRLFATHENLQDLAQKLIDPKDPSGSNQAMMELGALICLPKNPKCAVCPVRRSCRALKNDSVSLFPQRNARPRPQDVFSAAAVIQSKGQILLVRRESKGRFGGLWEFPTFESPEPLEPVSFAKAALRREFGLNCRQGTASGSFQHQLTHRTIHMNVVRYAFSRRPKTGKGRWVEIRSWRKLPFSRLQLRVAELAFTE